MIDFFREKILSWFRSEPSHFSRLSVQRLSLNHHPDNIAVFEASSLYEACLKADAAMRQEGIQGAVWVRGNQEADSPNRFGVVERLRGLSGDPAFGRSAMRTMNGLNIKTNLVEGTDGEPVYGFEKTLNGIPSPLDADPVEVLEPERLEELHMLSRVFGRTALSCRYEMNEAVDPHYDHFVPFPGSGAVPEKMFLGRDVRILVSRHRPSVIVYNTSDEAPTYDRGGQITGAEREKLTEAWQPAVGDYIFTCDLTWGVEKALAHSSPDFSCESEEDCRILDVFDVGDGRDRSELAAQSPTHENELG